MSGQNINDLLNFTHRVQSDPTAERKNVVGVKLWRCCGWTGVQEKTEASSTRSSSPAHILDLPRVIFHNIIHICSFKIS